VTCSVGSFMRRLVFLLLRRPRILATGERFVALDVELHPLREAKERAEAGVATEQEADEANPVLSVLPVEPMPDVVADGDGSEELEADGPIAAERLHSFRLKHHSGHGSISPLISSHRRGPSASCYARPCHVF